jgi:hypothetical protein
MCLAVVVFLPAISNGLAAWKHSNITAYYYTKSFVQRLQIGLGGGQAFKLPRLMSGLTEVVIFY